MTSKEALENIKKHMVTYHRYPVNLELKNEIDTLEKLVERDTPKNLCYDKLGRSECPSCDMSYLHNGGMNRNKYCGYCGQRLDWSGKDE